VLSTIAIGVLFIAYGLLSVRPDLTGGTYPPPLNTGRAVPVSTTIGLPDDDLAYRGTGVREAWLYPAPSTSVTGRRSAHFVVHTRRIPVRVARTARPRRDWAKTALIIGGSSAAGAGVGAAIGGGRGAAIGAALGGGISTLYEGLHR
jgi:hypothetical protein